MNDTINFADKHPIIRSFYYFAFSVIHPFKAFELLQKEKNFVTGFFLVSLKWGLCEFYVYYLYISNQVIFIQPWLNIPAEVFRYYELFYYIPFGILMWIVAAGIIQTLSLALGGKGTFTSTLNMVGIMVFTPFVFIDSIDTLFIFLNNGQWSIIFNSFTRTIFVLWSAILLSIGLYVIHKLSVYKIILITIVTTVISTFITIIFIR
jgi:hypothetical protein